MEGNIREYSFLPTDLDSRCGISTMNPKGKKIRRLESQNLSTKKRYLKKKFGESGVTPGTYLSSVSLLLVFATWKTRKGRKKRQLS